MITELDYFSLFDYSPRGKSDESKRSQRMTGKIKNGSISQIEKVLLHFQEQLSKDFQEFLNADTVLVPVPRSAPVIEGGLWPSLVLCQQLVKLGLAGRILPCLKRTKAIPKSHSSSSADSRASIKSQTQSLKVDVELIPIGTTLTLVDDVLTLGRTLCASAMILDQAYPQATIKSFVFMRTKGLAPEIDSMVNLSLGSVRYNEMSGKCQRIDP